MPTGGFDLTLQPGDDVIDHLVDVTVILSTEAQAAFVAAYSPYGWRVDLQGVPVFWFEREPVATFQPSIVGSSAEQSNSWMWSWNNINGLPAEVIAVSESMKALGEQLGVPELTIAAQSLDPAIRTQEGLTAREQVPQRYVYAAQAVSGIPVYFRAPVGGGSFAWFLLQNEEEFALPSATVSATADAIQRSLADGHLVDHRRALRGYADRRAGVALREVDGEVVLTVSDGDVTVAFDEQSRIARVRFALRA